MTFYTYLLHHKPTDTFYYGVRWKKGCDPSEFWVNYFSSSKKLVPLYRTLFGDESFEFEIRKVLQKPDKWLNRTDNKSIVYDVHPRGTLGKKYPEQSEKMKLRVGKDNPM